MRKQFSHLVRVIIVVCSFFILSASGDHDHDNHDHGEEKSNKPLTDLSPEECLIPKETQFFLEIETEMTQSTRLKNLSVLNGDIQTTINGNTIVSTPYNVIVSSIHVGIGSKVLKGQTLAVLNQNITAMERFDISTRLRNINAELEEKTKEYERLQQIEDVIEGKRLINLKIEIERLESQKSEYSNALSGGGNRAIVIKAPISGILNDFHLSVGSQLNEGEELFRIFNSNHVIAEGVLYTGNEINMEDSLVFTVTDFSGKHTVSDQVKFMSLSPDINPNSQSYKLILSVDNSDAFFRPGEFVTIGVSQYTNSEQLIVPNEAIVDINGISAVFVHSEPEIFELRMVKTGKTNGITTEIEKGVGKNERLVVKGSYQVKSIYLSK